MVYGKPGNYPSVSYYCSARDHSNIYVGTGCNVIVEVRYELWAGGDDDKATARIWFTDNPSDKATFTTPNNNDPQNGKLQLNRYIEDDRSYSLKLQVEWRDYITTMNILVGGIKPSDTCTITTKKYEEPGKPTGCAVIVESGFGDALQGSFHRTAMYAKSTFEGLGYVEGKNLKYFNRPDKDVLEEFIKKDLPTWLDSDGSDNLFIYIINHGVGRHLDDKIDFIPTDEGKVVLNNDKELLSSVEFGNWLCSIEASYNVGIIMIEACFSGEWIANTGLLPIQSDHIIITTTDDDHVSYGWTSGQAVFSKPFFEALQDGQTSYGEAWEVADEAVYYTM